jgi:hypothetical protein
VLTRKMALVAIACMALMAVGLNVLVLSRPAGADGSKKLFWGILVSQNGELTCVCDDYTWNCADCTMLNEPGPD